MNIEEPTTNSSNFSVCEAAYKIIQPCVEFLSNISFGHPVHPLEPAAPQFSEYLILNNNRRLRIIHIKSNFTVKDEHGRSSKNQEGRKRLSHSSLSEEYWFTRWNRPLKLGNCNCSFRRSQRFSALSSDQLPLSVYIPTKNNSKPNSICMSDIRNSNLSNYDTPPVRIVNVETFVERLIQETLFEAFQEFFMKKSIKRDSVAESGITNLGFVKSEDEFDGVILRHPLRVLKEIKSQIEDDKGQSSEKNVHKDCKNSTRKSCVHGSHGQAKKKPVVILLHGIGSSADIWWNIINTLTYKGYEVVAPDMLGHGYSSVPDRASAYKFKNLLKYTLAVFDHYVGCDESKNSIVIAHSYGCSLATALCRYRSQQIIQLILISGGGPTPLAPPVKGEGEETSILDCLRTVFKPLLFCGVKRTIFYSLRGKHFDVCNENSAVPNYILQYITDGQNWPEGDAAFHRRILIPTLLVHGLQDTQITLVQECEMERTIPRAFLELIPNAGHMCMLETPEHLSHMIMCFIDWWSR